MEDLILKSINTCEEFESKQGYTWARAIIVDYYTRTEEGWLLGCMVKVLSVTARQNPCQGGLSDSFLLTVEYKIGAEFSKEEWFVKIPKTLQTVAMDERELVMYNKIFPRLQIYLSETLYEEQEVDLPIPLIFASSFKGDGVHDFLVTENLRANGHFQVDNKTTKVAYMTAAMTSLANFHGITFSFTKSLGGKEMLFEVFPTIKEEHLPNCKDLKSTFNKTVVPYLQYLSKIRPDINQQTMVLSKFSKFLFPVFIDLENSDALKQMMTLVHGDAKLDNFLFKKVKENLEETYTAMIIDWQGCGYDFISNDLMWCLYGFVKNLPETGDMIHGFVDYSIQAYLEKLRSVFEAFGENMSDMSLPDCPVEFGNLIKKGFLLEFMRSALIRPVLTLKNRKLLLRWWRKVQKGEDPKIPEPSEVFKSDSYVNFILLYFKIATEINVFSQLASSLLSYMKDFILMDKKCLTEESESESEDEQEDVEEISETEVENALTNNNTEISSSQESYVIVSSVLEEVLVKTFENVNSKEQNTVKSMYGKVYVLKQSIKSL